MTIILTSSLLLSEYSSARQQIISIQAITVSNPSPSIIIKKSMAHRLAKGISSSAMGKITKASSAPSSYNCQMDTLRCYARQPNLIFKKLKKKKKFFSKYILQLCTMNKKKLFLNYILYLCIERLLLSLASHRCKPRLVYEMTILEWASGGL